MREFFRGWKRKVGCVALLLACVFMAEWVRSYSATGGVWIPFGSSIWTVCSVKGRLHFVYARCKSPESLNQFPQDVMLIESNEGNKSYVIAYYNASRHFKWTTKGKAPNDLGVPDPELKVWRAWGLAYAEKTKSFNHPDGSVSETIQFGEILHVHVVLPLTLLSAWLLLSTTRKSNQKSPQPAQLIGA
ncbi:hypothetical protein [Schlesneria sp. T3-172]|uniref:hypothetical protein n=1 Tax=Schlesneria sphaerica TaxID=3373610 RepID=UPI0037CA81BE